MEVTLLLIGDLILSIELIRCVNCIVQHLTSNIQHLTSSILHLHPASAYLHLVTITSHISNLTSIIVPGRARFLILIFRNLLNSYFQTNLMLEYRVYCGFIKSRRSTTAGREIFNNTASAECSNINNTAPPVRGFPLFGYLRINRSEKRKHAYWPKATQK